MLVNRLMRLSQQERRIAVQLLQARHEKDVIRKNRMMREKANEERRLKDFEDALNREAVCINLFYYSKKNILEVSSSYSTFLQSFCDIAGQILEFSGSFWNAQL